MIEHQEFNFETITTDQNGEIITQETKSARFIPEDLGNGTTLDMILVPEGTYVMGAAPAEAEQGMALFREVPQHNVTLESFYLGKFPVTQAQWRAVATNLPAVTRNLDPELAFFKGDDLPMERVSWYDATEFCARLSKATGRNYRLPSEAEWEYACRARTSTPFYFGQTITPHLANIADESFDRRMTTPVNTFPPNAFGLYDMHGNVWEWCADDWHDNYEGAPSDGSPWLGGGNEERAPLRGGSWIYPNIFSRSACRSNYVGKPNIYDNFGFRVAMDI